MAKQLKRHRGGQPGNRNAVKHGFYFRSFDKAGRSDLKKASSLEGIEEEQILLRMLVRQALESGDYSSIKPLIKTMNILEKLMALRRKNVDDRFEQVKRAVSYIARELYPDDPPAWRTSSGQNIIFFNESKPIVVNEAGPVEKNHPDLILSSLK